MGPTAHFEQGFCSLLNLPSAIEEEQYLIQHMKHVSQLFLKGIKSNSTLLFKKKDHQCNLKRMKVYRNEASRDRTKKSSRSLLHRV